MLGIFLIVSYTEKYKFRRYLILVAFCAALSSEPIDLIFRTRCPNCYNDVMCEPLGNGKVFVYWLSKIVAVFHPDHTKSVFFARSEEMGEMVLKSMTQRNLFTSISAKYNSSSNITASIIEDNIFRGDNVLQDVILCPNVKSISKLFKPLERSMVNLANTNHLWLDLRLSIEPVLLKFLSQVPNLNVPKFYGACGDLIFTEFKGKPLTNYFNSNWKQRMFLSFQLLEMADALTFFHPSLIIYLTDISPDNLVVNSSGIVSLIDLDNVIISERTGYQNYLMLNDIHVSRVLHPHRMVISPSEICSHALSDHNFYAVCRYILMDTGHVHSGLLNGLPPEVIEENPDILTLLHECGKPSLFANRISAGKHLKKIMEDMILTFGWNRSF